MNITELNQSLQFLFEEEAVVEIVIYTILKDEENPKKLDIKADDLSEITKMFKASINSHIVEKSDYSLLPLSTADERGKCFYQYDLELPEELTKLETVITADDIDIFDFRTNKLSDIDSLIIVLAVGDDDISIYKKVSPIEILGRGGYILGKANHRLERFNEQLLRISSGFQVIRVNEEIIILDLNAIEKSFGFQDVIKREATLSLNAIEQMQIIDDMDSLRVMVDDIRFARKLTKVAKSSPVIKLNIPNNDIISFAKKHPATKNMKYSDNNTKFKLTTKVSKELFLKLLNDDLLTSELTRLYYASLAKDGIDTGELVEQTANNTNE